MKLVIVALFLALAVVSVFPNDGSAIEEFLQKNYAFLDVQLFIVGRLNATIPINVSVIRIRDLTNMAETAGIQLQFGDDPPRLPLSVFVDYVEIPTLMSNIDRLDQLVKERQSNLSGDFDLTRRPGMFEFIWYRFPAGFRIGATGSGASLSAVIAVDRDTRPLLAAEEAKIYSYFDRSEIVQFRILIEKAYNLLKPQPQIQQ